MVQLKQSESKVRWCSQPLNWQPTSQPQLEPNTWVKLLEEVSPFAHDEALLLCQVSNWEWIGWIPDHGEATLRLDQFCLVP